MITLITGLPGAGKTLYALDIIHQKAQKENREVYYSGIANIKLPWIEIDPEKWHECPPNAIIVIDECQRLFRPRANGSKVPEYVSQLETHRHKGLDLFLITQHPTLIEVNVRRLVGLHFHCIRKFGMQKSRIHEFQSCRDNPDKQRKDSIKHDYSYNKKVYDFYKSAEVHTVQRRIPMFLILTVIIVPIGLTFAGYWTYNFFNKTYLHSDKNKNEAAKNKENKTNESNNQNQQTNQPQQISYASSRRNEIPGLPQSAPIYQEAIKPKTVPYPASCVASPPKCTCYTQQATKIADMPKDLCMQIVKEGYFVDWQEDQPKQQQQQTQQREPRRTYYENAPMPKNVQMYDIPFTSTEFKSSLPDAKMRVK